MQKFNFQFQKLLVHSGVFLINPEILVFPWFLEQIRSKLQFLSKHLISHQPHLFVADPAMLVFQW